MQSSTPTARYARNLDGVTEVRAGVFMFGDLFQAGTTSVAIEDIAAVLKLEPGLELESVLDAAMVNVRQNLAAHQQPARYVAVTDFPRTANGKVQKAKLRELVMEKLHLVPGSPLGEAMAGQESNASPWSDTRQARER